VRERPPGAAGQDRRRRVHRPLVRDKADSRRNPLCERRYPEAEKAPLFSRRQLRGADGSVAGALHDDIQKTKSLSVLRIKTPPSATFSIFGRADAWKHLTEWVGRRKKAATNSRSRESSRDRAASKARAAPAITRAHAAPRLWPLSAAIAVVALLGAGPALAQALDAAPGFLPEVAVRGRGWSQVYDTGELTEYGLGLVETFVLTALIAFHPASLGARRTREDFEAPRILFIYGLIGMVIGFLIMHHGYLIGFVIFGVGGLLRFKTDVDSSADTTRLILVTLIGLCVGLDLPVVALITTVSAWIILFALGRRSHYALAVRFDEKKAPKHCIEAVGERLTERGFQLVTVSKSKFKPAADYVIAGPNGHGREALAREMDALAADKQAGIVDWRLD
jgi:hypothetical protein